MKLIKKPNFLNTLCLAVIVLFMCSNCPKEPEPRTTLPSATFEGKNIVACKVNDSIWVNEGWVGVRSKLAVKAAPLGNSTDLEFYANAKLGNHVSEMTFSLSDVTSTGIYSLNRIKKRTQHYGFFAADYALLDSKSTDSLSNGVFEIINFDTTKKIMSGSFKFDIRNSEGKLYRKVTEGTFDIKI